MWIRSVKTIVVFISFFLPQLLLGQIAKPGIPLSVNNAVIEAPRLVTVSDALLERGRAKAQAVTGMKPLMFAWPADTSINVLESGSLKRLADGSEIYRLAIKSEGAFSLNITFSEYLIPPGVDVFIYTPDLETIRGAYTSSNNKKTLKLATTPVPGDELIIEVNIPSGNLDFQPLLSIGRIAHDFTDAFGFKSGFGKSGDCNVDINCPEGDDWQVEKRSVVKFIRGGYWLCSGALINNTANDGRALLYTANHCIASQVQAESSVFYFNYESSECDGSNGRLNQSISGSDLLATTTKLDFALIELSKIPPLEFEPYYAGWNRTVSSSNRNVVCIHHPSGDVKKITKSYGTIVTGNFGSGFDANTHWHIPTWNLGTTEGGSSGSPLFDLDHKIIGDLTGGDAGCDYNYNDYFQKFFVCWDKYPENDQQLKYWIDPVDNGAIIWNGYDPTTAGQPVGNYAHKPMVPQVGKEIRFDDKSEGQPAKWEWFFEGGSPSQSNLENPIVKFNKAGDFRVKLIVSNSYGQDSITQTISIKEFTGFEADQNRVVAGASIEYTDLSSGEPLSYQWQFEGGDPADWNGSDPMKIRYETPGIYDVSLILEYSDFIDTLYYRDYVKIEPETLFFKGFGLRTIKAEHASHVLKVDDQGWIAGSNSLGIDAFSNAFLIESDTLKMATGLRVPIGKLPESVEGTYLTAVVWDDEFNEIITDSIELTNDPFPDYQTIWFRHPVGIDSLVHAGFVLPQDISGLFCTKVATPRSILDEGSAYARRNGNWITLYEATGLVTDLAITLEIESIFPDFQSQIKLTPVITSDRIYLDLSNLVYEKFDVQLYDLLGKQIISDYALSDKYLELEFSTPVSGVYLMVLQLDNLSFTKKVVLVRNQ